MSANRTTIATYVAQQLYLKDKAKDLPKTLAQIGKELGVAPATVRRWLKRDHAVLWRDYWATVEELWESSTIVPRSSTLMGDLKRELQAIQQSPTPDILM